MQRRVIMLSAVTSALVAAGAPSLAEARHRHHAAATTLPGDWTEAPRNGPLTLVVSIPRQRLTVYDGTNVLATTPVSTGVPGHKTPTGVFSVIQKQRFHRSNLYSAAPMPFMQRITWSGVALHEGHVTGRPASHGCIRLPRAFAMQLWKATRTGVRVIVSEQEVVPLETDAPEALVPAPAPRPVAAIVPAVSAVSLANDDAATRPTKTVLASADPVPSSIPALQNDAGPTQAVSVGEKPAEKQAEQQAESAPAPAPEAASVPATEPKPVAEAPAAAPPSPAVATEAPVVAPVAEAPAAPKPFAIDKTAGPISVFFSRKEGKVFVRQNFTPIYQAAATFDAGAAPLGTHVVTVRPTGAGEPRRWLVASIPAQPASLTPVEDIMVDPVLLPRRHGRNAATLPASSVIPVTLSVREALARVHMSDETRDIVAAGIGPGASLIVSDLGLGSETGKGTEFIVQSR